MAEISFKFLPSRERNLFIGRASLVVVLDNDEEEISRWRGFRVSRRPSVIITTILGSKGRAVPAVCHFSEEESSVSFENLLFRSYIDPGRFSIAPIRFSVLSSYVGWIRFSRSDFLSTRFSRPVGFFISATFQSLDFGIKSSLPSVIHLFF
jgi:hypothetical protein